MFDDPPGVSWRAADDEELADVLARVLEVSSGPRDIAAAGAAAAKPLAMRMLDNAQARRIYSCEREWWSILALGGGRRVSSPTWS